MKREIRKMSTDRVTPRKLFQFWSPTDTPIYIEIGRLPQKVLNVFLMQRLMSNLKV